MKVHRVHDEVQEPSCDLVSGSAVSDDFFKISDKLLFIMNPTPAAQ
jgi:hypothetical protein